jgi:uncharacterized protein YegP (UPF0339 family)
MEAQFEIEKSENDQYFFRLRSSSETILLTSETYTVKASAKTAIASVKENAPADLRYERKESSDNRYFFVLKARNGETLGRSPLHGTIAGRDAAVATTKKEAPDAKSVDRA